MIIPGDFQAYLGVFLIGLSKAGFATGLGMLTTPLLATVIPAREAIGVVLPLLILSDLITISLFRKNWRLALIRWPLFGAVLGIAIAMFFVKSVPDHLLKLSIGGAGIFLTGLLIIRNVWYPAKTWNPSPTQASGVGAMAGFTSTLAHAAGPVMALFFMAQKIDKAVFVASNGLFFTLNNLMKLPPYLASGLINAQTLKMDLRFLPMIPLGVFTGWLLNRFLPQRHFNILVYALLLLTSAHLIFTNFPR
jgi:uncharacterized protein